MERENPIRAQFDIARAAIRAVVRGQKQMQLICSPSGLGKTYTVLDELRKAGIRANYVTPTNRASFVKELYDHRDNKVIFFDDCDNLMNSTTCANIAKMAFGPQHLVIHSTVEARKNASRRMNDPEKYDPGIPPPQFGFHARLIWCSNLNFTDPSVVSSRMTPHFQALVSRGLHPIWIDGSDPTERFDYVVWLATDGGMLNRNGMSKTVSEQAVNWFIQNRNRLKEISPRQLMYVATLYRDLENEPQARNALLTQLLSPEDQHDIASRPTLELVRRNEWRPTKACPNSLLDGTQPSMSSHPINPIGPQSKTKLDAVRPTEQKCRRPKIEAQIAKWKAQKARAEAVTRMFGASISDGLRAQLVHELEILPTSHPAEHARALLGMSWDELIIPAAAGSEAEQSAA